MGAQAWTISEIVAELGVSRRSVSVWVRDADFDEAARAARAGANRRLGARKRGPDRLQLRKQAEFDRLLAEGVERIGGLNDRDLLIGPAVSYASSVTHREIMGLVHALLRCEVSNPG